jgi:hypothetical protein
VYLSLDDTTHKIFQHNATSLCRISHYVLLTEYQLSISTAGYRKYQHLAAHIVATVHFDGGKEQAIHNVLILQVESVT